MATIWVVSGVSTARAWTLLADAPGEIADPISLLFFSRLDHLLAVQDQALHRNRKRPRLATVQP